MKPQNKILYNTKIVATLGPASSDKETITALYNAGATGFRLNLSHGDHGSHLKNISSIRALEKSRGHSIPVFIDLQGPKLRIGRFAEGAIQLEKGQVFTLDQNKTPGDTKRVQLPHPSLFDVITEGTLLLLDDGKLRLVVTKATKDVISTKVIVGGMLSDCKGLNIPGIALPVSALTEKDRKDLAFGLDHGIDIIALSFVQRPEDVYEAREILQGRAKIYVKIEKPMALEHLDEIVNACDGVMIARGDLGVEMNPEEVPVVQRRIISVCRAYGKPVIVATQMLESMVHSPTPTRAEASDVATAVYAGVDAVMLSAESAAGKYPIDSVAIMNRIIHQVENDPEYYKEIMAHRAMPDATDGDAITMAANLVSETIDAKAIVTFTKSGSTTLRASRERPLVPILAITPNKSIARFLSLVWGVTTSLSNEVIEFSHLSEEATKALKLKGLANAGESVVVTAGVPYEVADDSPILIPGSTNLLRIMRVPNDG